MMRITISYAFCLYGNLEIVKFIHSQNIIDIDSRGRNGTTPLMSAALFGKKEVFRFLMKKGADISKEDDDGENILHASCQGGNVDIVKHVLTRKVLYTNSTDNNGITPLMLAAGYGNQVVFHFLIERRANTLARDDADRTILHWACQGGNVKIVDGILTQNIVDVNSNDGEKTTPLLLAAYHGKRDVLVLLIEKGAYISAVDHESKNILHLSCTGGHVDTVKYVLNQSIVDINSKDDEAMTPVMLAASLGKREVFDILLKNGADLSVVDKGGDNILYSAIRGGNGKIVNYILIQNIVDINSKYSDGMTPVQLAAYYGQKEAFEILVKKGADLSAVDESGDNILHLACVGKDEEIMKHVLRLDILDINCRDTDGSTPLLLAIEYNARGVFDVLLESGADPSVVNRDGDNVLHLACLRGDEEMVKHVLKLHIVDINSRGSNRMTPLLLAAEYNTCNVFELLRESGADPSVVNRDGKNVLHFACIRGDEEMVKHVLKLHIVDINSRGSNGLTPLLLAAGYSTSDVIKLLLENGADPLVVNSDGDNVLHVACAEGDEDIVKYLLSQSIINFNAKNNKGLNAAAIAREEGLLSIEKLLLQTSQSLHD
ncbi:putative ankyrin repeat protein RF_0381 [Haliotis rubra]|uniref:putative ankyrin repeat protein RF_0381 n=1 Tax=Haliotis rubra TaxID=36100 RepID=UPI001EE53770|nr:putative ankyrin repeat protein RF_0381 [Haliotis rubra]